MATSAPVFIIHKMDMAMDIRPSLHRRRKRDVKAQEVGGYAFKAWRDAFDKGGWPGRGGWRAIAGNVRFLGRQFKGGHVFGVGLQGNRRLESQLVSYTTKLSSHRLQRMIRVRASQAEYRATTGFVDSPQWEHPRQRRWKPRNHGWPTTVAVGNNPHFRT